MKKPIVIPPVAMVISVILAIVLQMLTPGLIILHHPWVWVGLLVITAGLLLIIRTGQRFKAVGTTHRYDSAESTFVREGPNAISRNPMYLGMLSVLIGLAVMLGNPLSLAGALFFFVVTNFSCIPFEEARMKERFGQHYLEYTMSVRRWI